MNRIKHIFLVSLLVITLFFSGYGLWSEVQAKELEANTEILDRDLEKVETSMEELIEMSESQTQQTITAELEAEQLAIEIEKCKNP